MIVTKEMIMKALTESLVLPLPEVARILSEDTDERYRLERNLIENIVNVLKDNKIKIEDGDLMKIFGIVNDAMNDFVKEY